MKHIPSVHRLVALYPSTFGLGYAVFEGPNQLVDWGLRCALGKKKNALSLKFVETMLSHYAPDLVVTQDVTESGTRRSVRVRQLVRSTSRLVAQYKIRMKLIPRSLVRKAFAHANARTKQEIAVALVERFRELEPRLPRVRKPWMPEDPRMSIFEAVAVGIAYFFTTGETLTVPK